MTVGGSVTTWHQAIFLKWTEIKTRFPDEVSTSSCLPLPPTSPTTTSPSTAVAPSQPVATTATKVSSRLIAKITTPTSTSPATMAPVEVPVITIRTGSGLDRLAVVSFCKKEVSALAHLQTLQWTKRKERGQN